MSGAIRKSDSNSLLIIDEFGKGTMTVDFFYFFTKFILKGGWIVFIGKLFKLLVRETD